MTATRTGNETEIPLVEVFTASLDDLHRYAHDRHLYAVVDACDEPTVPAKFMELGEQRVLSLYKGTAQEEHWNIAPYLFQVDARGLEVDYARHSGISRGAFLQFRLRSAVPG